MTDSSWTCSMMILPSYTFYELYPYMFSVRYGHTLVITSFRQVVQVLLGHISSDVVVLPSLTLLHGLLPDHPAIVLLDH